MIRLTLPLPPSTNRAVRTGKGRHYTPARVHEFRAAVAAAIRAQLPAHKSLTGPVHVAATVVMHTRGLDLDNRDSKILWDALTRARFWVDDSQVCSRSSVRVLDAANPRVELEVVPVTAPALIDAWRARPQVRRAR